MLTINGLKGGDAQHECINRQQSHISCHIISQMRKVARLKTGVQLTFFSGMRFSKSKIKSYIGKIERCKIS